MKNFKVILIAFILLSLLTLTACTNNSAPFLNVSFYHTDTGFAVVISEENDCKFVLCNAFGDDFHEDVNDYLAKFNLDNPIKLAICSFSEDNLACISALTKNHQANMLFTPTPVSFDEHDKHITLKTFCNSNDIDHHVVSSLSFINNNSFCVTLINHISSREITNSTLSFAISYNEFNFGFLTGDIANQQACATLMNVALNKQGSTLQSKEHLDFLAFVPNDRANQKAFNVLTTKNIYVANYTENFLESVYDYLPNATIFTNTLHEKIALSVSKDNSLHIDAD